MFLKKIFNSPLKVVAIALLVFLLMGAPEAFKKSNVVTNLENRYFTTGVWNGFNDHQVVVECSNHGEHHTSLSIILKGHNNEEIGVENFSLIPYGTSHVLLNKFPIQNNYGMFNLVESGNKDGNVSCYTITYKMDSNGELQYSTSMPVGETVKGRTGGVYNSMNPSAGIPVYNWLSVTNPGKYNFSANVTVRDQTGRELPEMNFRVSNLKPNQRLDIALGHPAGQVVGTWEINPDDSEAEYGAFLSRYSQAAPDEYNFGMIFLASKGYSDSGIVPASTMGPATNWGEISNLSATSTNVLIEVFNRDGRIIHAEEKLIPRYSQYHIFLNQYIGELNVGNFRVRALNNENASLTVQSVYYGHEAGGSSKIAWAYNASATGGKFINSASYPINTNLNAPNWLKVFSEDSSVHSVLKLELYDSAGNLVPIGEKANLTFLGSSDFPIHELVGSNFVGNLKISSDKDLYPFQGQLVRVFTVGKSISRRAMKAKSMRELSKTTGTRSGIGSILSIQPHLIENSEVDKVFVVDSPQFIDPQTSLKLPITNSSDIDFSEAELLAIKIELTPLEYSWMLNKDNFLKTRNIDNEFHSISLTNKKGNILFEKKFEINTQDIQTSTSSTKVAQVDGLKVYARAFEDKLDIRFEHIQNQGTAIEYDRLNLFLNSKSGNVLFAFASPASTVIAGPISDAEDTSTHLECSAGICKKVNGQGPDRCQSTIDCSHKECNKDGICVLFRGGGPDRCRNDTECSHKECSSNGICADYPGNSEDTCSDNYECGHKACKSGLCEIVAGRGENECEDFQDCQESRHKECSKEGLCTNVDGKGPDECSDDKECGHKVCDKEGFCSTVKGKGPNLCNFDTECGRLACDKETASCTIVPGKGKNECRSDYECGKKGCKNGLCVPLPGLLNDQCSDDSECENKVCTEYGFCDVGPSTIKECSTDRGCDHITHLECRNGSCDRVPGPAGSEGTCVSARDCKGVPSPSDSPTTTSTPIGTSTPIYTSTSTPVLTDTETAYNSPSATPELVDTRSSSNINLIPMTAGLISKKEQARSALYFPNSGSVIGNPQSAVRITIFQDIECGMCRLAANELVPVLLNKYVDTGLAYIEFKEYPLIPRPQEMKLAESAQCAGDQGKYWQYLKHLYSIKKKDVAQLASYAAESGLDIAAFNDCIISQKMTKKVERHRAEADRLGIKGTPTFMINDKKIEGFRSISEFSQAIETARNQKLE